MDILLFGHRSSLASGLSTCVREYWPGARVVLVDPSLKWAPALASATPVASVVDHRDVHEDPADAVRRVREQCSGPVLLVGGPCTSETLNPLMQSGADDFLEEPFQPMEAFARIWMLLRRSSPPGLVWHWEHRTVPKVGSAVL